MPLFIQKIYLPLHSTARTNCDSVRPANVVAGTADGTSHASCKDVLTIPEKDMPSKVVQGPVETAGTGLCADVRISTAHAGIAARNAPGFDPELQLAYRIRRLVALSSPPCVLPFVSEAHR